MKTILLYFFLFFFINAQGQKMLSIEEALETALGNNYGIRIAHNEADIARAFNTPGNAGMLPTIQLKGSANYEVNDVSQRLSNGNENTYPNLSTSAVAVGAVLNWTVFDGGKMFITKNRLNEMQNLGEIVLRDKVLQTCFNVTEAYYNVVKQKQQLAFLQEMLNYNRQRLRIAHAGFQSGIMAKSDYLQAQIDMNVTLADSISQLLIIRVIKNNLLILLGPCSFSDYDVSDSIPNTYNPDFDKLKQTVEKDNTGIQMFEKQKEIARLSLIENKRNFLPSVNFNSGYFLSQYDNSAGSVLKSFSLGPSIGASLIIPLYNSGETRRKSVIADYNLKSADDQLQNFRMILNTELKNAFDDFETQKKLIILEEENSVLAKEFLEICIQRFEKGQTNSLEVHQAQENYMKSCTRLINIGYNLKIAETKLKQLISEANI